MIIKRFASTTLALLATFFLAPGGPMAAENSRKTVAFVVGFESYKDADFDKLQYPAQDAREVFDQTKAVTNFDKDRSWLMLAQRSAPETQERDNDARTIRQRYLSPLQISNELQLFLQNVTDNDNVFIYIGGHGATGPNNNLLLATSEFDPYRKINALPFSHVVDNIREWIDGRKLANVRTAVFLNVCGAGNAVAQGAGNDELDPVTDLNALRKLTEELRFGKSGFAIFPASARNLEAFEDPERRKHSVFAYYLIEGLRGGAADQQTGEIKAKSLFAYIENGLNDFQKEKGRPIIRLPRNDSQFDEGMVIGVTKLQQGEANYMAATSLLAASREILPGTANNRSERQAQSNLLADLAVDQYGQAIQRNLELKQRALLRRAEIKLSRAESSSIEEIQKDLSNAASGTFLKESERAYMESMKADVSSGPIFSTLGDFRKALDGGMSFSSAILTVNLTKTTEPCVGQWQQLLSDFSGAQKPMFREMSADTAQIDAPGLQNDLLDQLQQQSSADRTRLLVVVYCGPSITRSRLLPQGPSGRQSGANSAQDLVAATEPDRLFPFGQQEIEQVAGIWTGPIVVIIDASYGGVLLDEGAAAGKALTPRHDISLFLAAGQKNGAVSNRTSLIAILQSKVANPEDFPAEVREQPPGRPYGTPTVYGIPIWVPQWGLSVKARLDQLELLKHWAPMIARGCASAAFDSCVDEIGLRNGARDPFERLVKASALDLVGLQQSDASGQYTEVAQILEQLASTSKAAGLGVVDAQKNLKRIANIVNQRVTGTVQKQTRKVFLVLMGVDEYSSPLVPPLPRSSADLNAYQEALSLILGPSTEVIPLLVGIANNPGKILQTLEEARKLTEDRPQDLVIFIFSGRGIEINGRRFLGTASAQVADGLGDSPLGTWRTDGLLDLWQIADAMKSRRFLAIYDAQFTPTIHQEGRVDELLDKHLDSVRPQYNSKVATTELTAQQTTASALPAGEMPSFQTHIWFEGRLTAAPASPLACVTAVKGAANVVSPLAAAIISTLRTGLTYRSWMDALAKHRCFSRTSGSVVFQGELDIPVFATGQGAELIEFFRSEDARRDVNLRAALGVVRDAARQFKIPRHRMAVAAILVALVQLHQDRPELATIAGEYTGWLDDALSILRQLTFDELDSEDASKLWSIRAELLVRLHMLQRDPLEALRLLRDVSPVDVLSERGLAHRMVEVTKQAMSVQSADILQKTARRLEELRLTLPAADTASRSVQALQQEDRVRRREAFRISPPPAAASAASSKEE